MCVCVFVCAERPLVGGRCRACGVCASFLGRCVSGTGNWGHYLGAFLDWVPCVDGDVLPMNPYEVRDRHVLVMWCIRVGGGGLMVTR